MAAKQARANVLACMPNRTKCILMVSGTRPGHPPAAMIGDVDPADPQCLVPLQPLDQVLCLVLHSPSRHTTFRKTWKNELVIKKITPPFFAWPDISEDLAASR
jgi:hypothetical protein